MAGDENRDLIGNEMDRELKKIYNFASVKIIV